MIFEVKFVKKKGVITESRWRTTDTLFNDLESVAFAIEGSDLNTTEDHFVPSAKCIIQDTTERQLVTRPGLQRLRCCVCHLHHDQTMKSPLRVRQFFKTVLQHVHNSGDVIAGDANAAAYKYFKKQQHQDLYNSSVAIMLRKMQREGNEGRPFESRTHIDSYINNHFSQLGSASDLDLLLHGYSLTEKTTWTQNHERILEQLACANTRQREKTWRGQLSLQRY